MITAVRPMIRTAQFSPCRTWRYSLTRIWDKQFPLLAVIGLNPSTADETQDDPTVRRCMGYAHQWGFGGLIMLNLYGFRSTDPKGLRSIEDPVGPGNDESIVQNTHERTTLCAWGNHGAYQDRAAKVRELLWDRKLVHLGLTKEGHPRHPLYLRADEEPRPWE